MNVLFISHSSVVPVYQEKLGLLAKKPGVRLTLLLPHYWPEAGQRVCSKGTSNKNYTILSKPIMFEGRVGWHFYPLLSKYVREIKPDIIHVEEEPYSMVAWQAVRAARKIGVKVVFFSWENIQETFRFPQNKARNAVLGHADYAIAGNQEASLLLIKSSFPQGRISVLPQYGVNPEKFKKKNNSSLRKELGVSGFTVGYIGRLVEEKGIQHLIEAISRMKKRTELILVGNGPFKSKLEEQTRRLGLASRVWFISAVDQGKIPDYLNCMDALVLPSITMPWWKEQFGRVLIEAQACEVPVVGSSSGAIPEVIGPAGAKLVFSEGDVAELSLKLNLLASSAVLRSKFGRQGRKRVLERFTNQRIADKIYGIYKDIIAAKT